MEPNWTVGSKQKVRRSGPKLKDLMILCSLGTDLPYGEAWRGQHQAAGTPLVPTALNMRRQERNSGERQYLKQLPSSGLELQLPDVVELGTRTVLSSNSSLPCISSRMNTPHVHIQTAPSLPVLLHWCGHNTSTLSLKYCISSKEETARGKNISKGIKCCLCIWGRRHGCYQWTYGEEK